MEALLFIFITTALSFIIAWPIVRLWQFTWRMIARALGMSPEDRAARNQTQ